MTRAAIALLLALALAAVLVVGDTWRVFSQVMDEPAHIGAGLEWLAAGSYTIEAQHPPLARIAVAVGPWLRDIPFVRGSLLGTGNRILYHDGEYRENLASARAGTIPFLLLSIAVVALWSWRLGGPLSALLAVFFFVTLPPVLAHAGLATTDFASAATIAAAIFLFSLWLERRTRPRTILLGLALGAALATKLSAVGYLPAAMLPILLAHWWGIRAEVWGSRPRLPAQPQLRRDLSILIAGAVAILVIWGLMRFSFGPLIPPERATEGALQWIGKHVRVPAPELFWGFQELGEHSEIGHLAFLRGETAQHGWVHYFPLTFAIKTPIPFLLLSLAGAVAAILRARRGDARPLAIFLAALGILAVAMTSTINIGVRHILPMYPLLAVVAGLVLSRFQRTTAPDPRPLTPVPSNTILAIALAALLAWQLANLVRAHPDHLAWFNEIAGDAPHEWLLDSNLDWGQDLLRLEDAARLHDVDALSLSYFGSALPQRHDLPPLRFAHPTRPSTGWIAVSRMNLEGVGLLIPGRVYRWLDGHEPVEVVGKSILLYYLPPPPEPVLEFDSHLFPVLLEEPYSGVAGRQWTTTVIATWRGREPIYVGFGEGSAAFPPGVTRPGEFEREAGTGALIIFPKRAGPSLTFDLLLRDANTGAVVAVPQPRASELSGGAVRITTLSPEAPHRTLRIYDLGRAKPARARLRVSSGERLLRDEVLTLTQPEPTGPNFTETGLEELGSGEGATIDIEPLEPGMLLWAMAVEFDREDGMITIAAPDASR